MNTTMTAVRNNIVRKRAYLQLSQAALASRANVSRPTVSKIEQGDSNVTIRSLEKIAMVLGCRVDELFETRSMRANSAELDRRAHAPDSDFVDARSLSRAIEEANEARYSNAGRRRRRQAMDDKIT
jgi:transcriptional regulator with XRE-family HTH domain